MKYGYYPGCSLEKNARAYHDSAMAVAGPLGLEFQELDDWNCCGATEYIAITNLPAYALVARNLAIAEKLESSDELIAPCSACYLNLSKVAQYVQDSPKLAQQTNSALAAGGMNYTPGSVHVRHLLDVVVNDVGFEEVAAQVRKPLKGLRVAPYYGCLIVRPGFGGDYDDTEQPMALDKLLRALGAEVVDFPMKAQCCGGHMTQISQDTACDMLHAILKNATDNGADLITTLCPMCQLNLDGYQSNVNQCFGTSYQLPVLYFTQLMGVAFGMSEQELGIGKELVDARPALAKIGTERSDGDGPGKKKRLPKEALPMPKMEEV